MLSAFVITGFLGSGKTTLLINSVREYLKNRRIAIIVNEFGEVGVDGKVLKNAYSQVLELPEGCICCTLHAEFEKALWEIRQKYDPEVLLVETSGAAEPFPVMLSLQSLGCTVEGVMCLIDACNFEKYSHEPTARHQIGSSNMLVLNKTDLVDEEKLKSTEQEVVRIWNSYRLKNLFTGEPVFRDFKLYKTSYGKLPAEVFEGIFALKAKLEASEEDYHQHHLEHQVLYFDQPLEYEKLVSLLESFPKEVFRAKGVVRVKEVPQALVVNYAFGGLDLSQTLPDYQGKSFLVVIKKSDN